jgi:hypothetical protein
MNLPSTDNLKARCPNEDISQDQRLENPKSSLRTAYELVAKANKSSHHHNKQLYDRKAKIRSFEVNDLVYLYTPVTKPGLSRKFKKTWSGPLKVTKKISELNYELEDQRNRKRVVHINRMKKAHNQELCDRKPRQKVRNSVPKQSASHSVTSEDDEVKFGPFPLVTTNTPVEGREHATPSNRMMDAPDSATPALDTPSSEQYDPSYLPPETPRSRKELQTTRPEPPFTRYRARIASQVDEIV